MTGTIKRIQREKGFGFILGQDGNEYFFHRSSVVGAFDALRDGQSVRFQDKDTPKGPRAEDVVPS